MKKTMKLIAGLVLLFTPTLQVAAQETKGEQFKKELLAQIKQEIKDLTDQEIRAIIDTVEANITEYIDHYEAPDATELLTKDQKLVADLTNTNVMPQSFGSVMLRHAEEQVIAEQLKPKFAQLTARQGEDTLAKSQTTANTFTTLRGTQTLDNEFNRWDLLDKGDVLVNLDNGKLGLKWGHVGMMYDRGDTPGQSRTIEILGFGDVVQFKNYKTTWHDNKTDRISHNYARRFLGTGAPERAAEAATKWIGKGYSLWPVLGDTSAFYCTELVFMAYKEQGVNLGNGMDMGSWGILMPKRMYCSSELASYYRQNMNGKAGQVC